MIAEMTGRQRKHLQLPPANVDGNFSVNSDNDTAFEDDEDLDIQRRHKKSSRYSSKKFSNRARLDDGYSTSGLRSGVDSEAEDGDDRSSSTSGLYGSGLRGNTAWAKKQLFNSK